MNTLRKVTLFLIFILSLNKHTSAQQFPADFTTKTELWLPLLPAVVTDEMRTAGITKNPFQSSNSDVIAQLCGECGAGNFLKGYLELYRSADNDHDDAGVVIIQFSSQEQLEQVLPYLQGQSNLAFLIAGPYLIKIWSDVSNGSEEILERVSNYYITKTGAEIYPAQENIATAVAEATTEEMVDYEKQDSYDANPVIAEEPKQDIPFNKTRKLQYLHASDNGLTGFFDDGTVSECQGCTFCKESVDELITTPPSFLYGLDSSVMAMFKSKDDMDAIGIPLDQQHPQPEWIILDFKQTQKIPDCP